MKERIAYVIVGEQILRAPDDALAYVNNANPRFVTDPLRLAQLRRDRQPLIAIRHAGKTAAKRLGFVPRPERRLPKPTMRALRGDDDAR